LLFYVADQTAHQFYLIGLVRGGDAKLVINDSPALSLRAPHPAYQFARECGGNKKTR
jgi:hypothetical protein